MAYGRRSSYGKSATGTYRRNRFSTRSIVKAPYRKKTRYVAVARNVEKKYADQTMVSTAWLPETISYEATPGTPASAVVQGVKFMSQMRKATGTDGGNNLVSFVAGGSTTATRVGNKINAKWLDLGVTLEAAKSPVNQQGEQVNVEGSVGVAQYYMKTIYRLVIVKDMQANNPTNTVSWGNVFGAGTSGIDGTFFGATDKLDIPNMGRFRIIKDITVTLDADEPMKNVRMGCYPGQLRFNSANSAALTDKGYYLVIAQDVLGTANSISFVIPGNVRCGCRLTFTD